MSEDRSFWNRCSGIYEKTQISANHVLYDQVTEEVRKYIDRDKDVLELACGTGNMTRVLHSEARSWIGTDFAEKMIEKARSLSTPDVHYEVADATSLQYTDSSFDVVIIANALHLMPEPDKALSEIGRVLRPGGILLSPTFVYDGKVNRVKLWFLHLVGFPDYFEWSSSEYREYVASHGFEVISSDVIRVGDLPECFLVSRKN